MDKKSIIILISILFVLCTAFATASFADNEDRSYSIPFANIHLYIQENGSLHVVETLHYSFSGTYNGITRDIPVKSNEKISNLKVTTKGTYSKFSSTNYGQKEFITVYLYSNPEKTVPITNKDVEVNIEYDFIVTQLYNDGATLQYNLWGDGWDVNLGKLNAYIHLNNKNSVQYWSNPSDFVSNTEWDKSNINTLVVNTHEIGSGKLFELRMTLPKNYFNNPLYGVKHDTNGLENFEKLQKEYEGGLSFFNTLYGILSYILILLWVVPITIYFIYGREPKISYNGIYEHEHPTKESPAIVNALYSGNVGKVDMNGFKATVLSLLNKKYLQLDNLQDSDEHINNWEELKNSSIIFNNDLDLSNLTQSERLAFITLNRFSDNNKNDDGKNTLDMAKFKKDMENEELAKKFKSNYDSWSNAAEKEATNNIEKIFISTGYDYVRLLGFLTLIISGITLFLGFFDLIPFYFLDSVAFLIIVLIVSFILYIIYMWLPNQIFGRWTMEGREIDEKWKNFKRYLKDFSLIKEHPPSSIVI